jgi:hypothetical protein
VHAVYTYQTCTLAPAMVGVRRVGLLTVGVVGVLGMGGRGRVVLVGRVVVQGRLVRVLMVAPALVPPLPLPLPLPMAPWPLPLLLLLLLWPLLVVLRRLLLLLVVPLTAVALPALVRVRAPGTVSTVASGGARAPRPRRSRGVVGW